MSQVVVVGPGVGDRVVEGDVPPGVVHVAGDDIGLKSSAGQLLFSPLKRITSRARHRGPSVATSSQDGPGTVSRPRVVLLRPRGLPFLDDQIDDLVRAPEVEVVREGHVPYGSLGKLPGPLAWLLAALIAPSLRLGEVRVLVIFHPWQYPIAAALLRRSAGCELWYSIWDRYEEAFAPAYHADERLKARAARRHRQASNTAAISFAVSTKLADLEQHEGRQALVVPLGADSFPAPDPVEPVVAVSFGFHGRRVDWELLRSLVTAMPELVLLVIGAVGESLADSDADFRACRSLPNIVWLGYRQDEEVAQLVRCADVGIVPFRVDAYNDAGMPHRILKLARLGRRTVTPMLAGVSTFDQAVTRVEGQEAWMGALRAEAGRRRAPDMELRAWALGQTSEKLNSALWRRLADLGICTPIGEKAAPEPGGLA